MNSSSKPHPKCSGQAFSLVEMLAVIAVLMILLVAGIRLGGGPSSATRRSATDMISGLVERARVTAIARRAPVLLALASPADLPAGEDGRYRLGLFQIPAADGGNDSMEGLSRADAIPLGRWNILERGIVLGGGGEPGLVNPMDEPTVEVGISGTGMMRFHGIIINPRGGIRCPAGSTPAVIRIAEGNFQNGKPIIHQRRDGLVAENLLRIGRHNARPYQIDR